MRNALKGRLPMLQKLPRKKLQRKRKLKQLQKLLRRMAMIKVTRKVNNSRNREGKSNKTNNSRKTNKAASNNKTSRKRVLSNSRSRTLTISSRRKEEPNKRPRIYLRLTLGQPRVFSSQTRQTFKSMKAPIFIPAFSNLSTSCKPMFLSIQIKFASRLF